MNKNYVVLIYDWRIIVAKGIESILKDHFQKIIFKTLTNEEDFLYSIKNLHPIAVFIQEQKLNKFNTETKKFLINKTKLIIIGNQNLHKFSNIAFYLPLGASENYLIKNFSKTILESLDLDFYEEAPTNEKLTNREIEIIRLVALGYTNQQIADKLYISPHTVITHRKNISKKLGIKTISGLTIYAILNNIINLDEIEGKNI